MTWKEFKQKIEEFGITDDDDILYIDAYPDDPHMQAEYDDEQKRWKVWA